MKSHGAFSLPDERPENLSPRRLSATWWRIDSTHPDDWQWERFAVPLHRFDPISGRFRVRYAASTPRAAARERFPERRITDVDAGLWLVELAGQIRVLDLCAEETLDRLGVDDRINTARMPHVRTPARPDPFLDTCGHLADLVADWWSSNVVAICYRSRTTPQTGRNLAFCHHANLTATATELPDARDLLVTLVLGDGFTVPGHWLARL